MEIKDCIFLNISYFSKDMRMIYRCVECSEFINKKNILFVIYCKPSKDPLFVMFTELSNNDA